MNHENLNNLADELMNGGGGERFDMMYADCCALGVACRLYPEIGKKPFYGVAETLLGVVIGTPEWMFMFGGRWGRTPVGKCPEAAAERIRYVLQHGGAPSSDQWESFEQYPRAVVAVAQPEPEEALV
jgi:hypothetical protein